MNRADLLRKTGFHKFFKPFFSGIGHVVLLHRVCNNNDYDMNKILQISQAYLENLLLYFIKNKIDIVSLDECYRRINSNGKSKRFASITFDDGYADNFTHALPVFEKYNVPFSIFLSTGFPDHKNVLWWYLLEDLVLKNKKIVFKGEQKNYQYTTLTMEEKRAAFGKIRRYILNSNPGNLYPKLQNIFGISTNDLLKPTKQLALNWAQVKELANHPLVTIGSHGVNHMALKKLSKEEVFAEIKDSIQRIEEKTGKQVNYLAYPYGGNKEAGPREFKFAGESGIKMTFTSKDGNIHKKHIHELHSLPRIGITEEWNISHLDLFINGFIPFINNFSLGTKRSRTKNENQQLQNS